MTSMKTSDLAPKSPNIFFILAWAALLSVVIMMLARYQYLPEAPDKVTYDWRTAMFSDRQDTQRKDIAVILIDDDSIAQYWARSPVDKGMLAELIRAVDASEPAAIGLDFIFDRPGDPVKEAALMKAIQEARAPVIIGAIDDKANGLRRNSFAVQERFLRNTGKQSGHIRFTTDKSRYSIDDTVVRYVGAAAKNAPVLQPFAVKLAATKKPDVRLKNQYIAWLQNPEPGKAPFASIKVPEHKPVDGSGDGSTVLPDYQRVLLKDRIVLIGSSFIDMDRHLTPLSYFDEKKIPGVFIHAQIVAQLLDGRGLFDLDVRMEFAALFLLAALGFFLGYRFNLKKYDFFMGVVGISLLIVAGIIAFSYTKTILPSTALSLSWVISVTAGHSFRWFLGYIKTSASTSQTGGTQ